LLRERPDDLEPARIGSELIDALVEIHDADWRGAGLEGFGKPSGYLQRQLKRFTGLWEVNATREVPAIGETTRWLAEYLPESRHADDRPRRLPRGERDVHRAAAQRGLRLGARDDR